MRHCVSMRSLNYSIISPFVIWLFLMLPSHLSQAEEPIVISFGFPVDHELFKAGEEVLSVISSRMGESMKLISIPDKRSAILLKNNDIHAEFARVGEYQKKVPFAIKVAEPIVEVSQYAYSLKSDISIDGWGSLKNYRSVALRGMWIVEIYMANYQVSWVNSISSAFQFLKSGRADICVANSIRVDTFLADTDFDASGIQRLEPAVYSTLNYTFFSPSYPQLALRYDVALRSMKTDGTYQAILAKYGM